MGRIYKRTKRETSALRKKYHLENTRKNCGQFKNLFLEKIKIAWQKKNTKEPYNFFEKSDVL